jgi:hypothetical protein
VEMANARNVLNKRSFFHFARVALVMIGDIE